MWSLYLAFFSFEAVSKYDMLIDSYFFQTQSVAQSRLNNQAFFQHRWAVNGSYLCPHQKSGGLLAWSELDTYTEGSHVGYVRRDED